MQYEGFWCSKQQPYLPVPFEEANAWKGQKKFLDALAKKERFAVQRTYRGFSRCRCCDKPNGSADFSLNGWTWPEGYAHYIKEHNVRPSLAFQMFILGADHIRDLED